MIEHDPWVGPLYGTEGIAGQRLGIVGYSHWNEDDHAQFTVDCMRNVVSGEWNIGFFNAIAGYFGMPASDFYNRVVMFEFVPCAIGGGENRYAVASQEQTERGRSRMLEIAERHLIDKLLVFTTKGWNAAPPTIEEQAAGANAQLGDTGFRYGHYRLGDRMVPVVGLRHPQYASKAKLTKAVKHALAL